MSSPNYLEIFSIDKFIEDCLELDWFEIYMKCLNMGIFAKVTYFPINEPDYKNKEQSRHVFTRFMNDLSFIIDKKQSALIPPGMSYEIFLKLRPLVEKLVSSHDLSKDWLRLYKN